MAQYATPGVYIEEIPVFPPSIAGVSTAVPVFIGHAHRAGAPLNVPTRITSLFEFKDLFGTAPDQPISITVMKVSSSSGAYLRTDVAWQGAAPTEPAYLLYYAVQHYFENGGGPCYIYNVADTATAVTAARFIAAIAAIEAVDEPTLLVFPDAVKVASDADYGSVVDAALGSCAKMQDRFTICDVRNAVPGGTVTAANVQANFRMAVTRNTVDFLKYGAAYFPYVRTLLRFVTSDSAVTLASCQSMTLQADGSPGVPADLAAAGTLLDASTLASTETAVYNAVRAFLDAATITLPPSAAVAGLYATTDRTRGVWKTPANAGLSLVTDTAIPVTNDLQDQLNIDPATGKSVNAIRTFFGRGTLVWGGRTLAGNDNEWRYVSVRRFANFVEESVAKAIAAFVFEPNNANTWVKVRAMIENFLINQWRNGALVGAKPEHAFRVSVGLGQTMSAQDILEGYLIVEVHLAIVRPAEFIVLKFMQKQQES